MFDYIIVKNSTIMNKPALSYYRGDYFTFDKNEAMIYPNLHDLDDDVAKLQKQYHSDNVRAEILK